MSRKFVVNKKPTRRTDESTRQTVWFCRLHLCSILKVVTCFLLTLMVVAGLAYDWLKLDKKKTKKQKTRI